VRIRLATAWISRAVEVMFRPMTRLRFHADIARAVPGERPHFYSSSLPGSAS
jgi:hypothetical protein